MTTSPQDDLTAERAAKFLKQYFAELLRDDGEPWVADVELIQDLIKTASREALRDVLSDLDSLHWKDHWYADQLRKKINDRLASKGG